MLSQIWNTALYEPLLNALAFLVAVIPGGDMGLAVIILTIAVKFVLLPLSHRSIASQAEMTMLQPELNKIKESGVSKEEQARQTFELYKKHKVNPFSGCLLMLLQIPIIFALYYVFLKGISFEAGYLYSFVPVPENANPMFLSLLDITEKSAVLAVLAGVSQFLQAYFMPKPVTNQNNPGSFSDSFAKSMHLQMKYVFPFIVALIAYNISGAVALYWITSNVFMTVQQIYLKKKEFNKPDQHDQNNKHEKR